MNATQTGTGRVVVGIDGSAASLDALAWAAHQADLTGAALELVAAWEWPTSFGWAVPVPADYDPEAEVRSVLDNAVASAPPIPRCVWTPGSSTDIPHPSSSKHRRALTSSWSAAAGTASSSACSSGR